jgi:hypothetical protein
MRRYLVLLVLLLLGGCTAAPVPALPADDPPLPERPTPTGPAPSFSPPPETYKPFQVLGPVVTPQTLGQAATGSAGPEDLTETLLPNGFLRLYFVDRATRTVRSVLTDRQRQRFVADPGARLPAGTGAPRIVSRVEGGWRMYYVQDGVLRSAVSTDALAFTPEAGTRLTLAQAGAGDPGAYLSGGAVIRLGDGYRMYVGIGHPGDSGDYVLSARSTDGLQWTVEPGKRLGPGASRPFVYRDGASVALYFVGHTPTPGIYVADSDDGLDFEAPKPTSVPGVLDGAVVPARSGDQWMYYTTYDAGSGGSVAVATKPED